MDTTRVVLADDNAAVRAGIRCLLQGAQGIEVVGEAKNGVEALSLVDELEPDILLLDMEMPELSGVEVARRMNVSQSQVRILALSSYDDRQYILELLANGAAGYLTKDEAPQQIIEVVRRVARGERGWFCDRAAASLTRNPS